MNAIEIKGLSKSFRGLYAVNNLNMTDEEGTTTDVENTSVEPAETVSE